MVTGEFRPYQVIDVHAKVAGYLKKISVDVGDRVKAGQVLATLEIPEMRDELAQSTAELGRSSAEESRARGDLERAQSNAALVDLSYKRLTSVNKSEPGLIAQQEIDEALARKQSADAQVSAAKAALAAATQEIGVSKAKGQRTQTMSDYSKIAAPFSGMITKRFADTGAMIQAGTAANALPLVRLAQIDRLRMVLPVPESVVGQVKIGAALDIKVPSLGKTFTGRVSRFTGDVQTATRTMDVEVDVPNPGGILIPGMYAEAVLTLKRHNRALTIPIQAIAGKDGKYSVMVVSPAGILQSRPIQTDIETATKVEVTSGLSADELVVVGDKSRLKPGQKVEAKVVGLS